MTTEDDFQTALDAQPEDWHTRLVFADWLDERDDPRAAGYRALGRNRLRAKIGGRDCSNEAGRVWMGRASHTDDGTAGEHWKRLPDDWFELVEVSEPHVPSGKWHVAKSRRELEDAAARAFAKLPAERRSELLAAGNQP